MECSASMAERFLRSHVCIGDMFKRILVCIFKKNKYIKSEREGEACMYHIYKLYYKNICKANWNLFMCVTTHYTCMQVLEYHFGQNVLSCFNIMWHHIKKVYELDAVCNGVRYHLWDDPIIVSPAPHPPRVTRMMCSIVNWSGTPDACEATKTQTRQSFQSRWHATIMISITFAYSVTVSVVGTVPCCNHHVFFK